MRAPLSRRRSTAPPPAGAGLPQRPLRCEPQTIEDEARFYDQAVRVPLLPAACGRRRGSCGGGRRDPLGLADERAAGGGARAPLPRAARGGARARTLVGHGGPAP